MFVFYEIVGFLLIAVGGLFLTRKKFVYSNLYDLLFLLVVLIVPQVYNFLYLRPYYSESLMGAYVAFAIFLALATPLALFFRKDRYTVVNVGGKMIEEALISVLEAEGIVFEVRDRKIVLTEYNRFIKFRPSGMLNYGDVSFGDIRKLPFSKKIKDSFTYKVRQIERAVFPSLAIFLLLLGLAFVIFLIVMQWKFHQIL